MVVALLLSDGAALLLGLRGQLTLLLWKREGYMVTRSDRT